MSKIELPIFPSRIFMISEPIFKSLNPFWSYFPIGSEKVVQFNSFLCGYFPIGSEKVVQFNSFLCSNPVLPKPCIKEAIFSTLYISCLLCLRLINSVSLFLGSQFYVIDICIFFSTSSILFWWL